MKQKRIFIILGALGFVFMLLWLATIGTVAKTLYRKLTAKELEVPVIEMTLCSENAENLCIINFGANNLKRMVINFQFPNKENSPFYVKARNRDMVAVYTCEMDEDEPSIAHCTGLRTPLGETIELEAYTTDGDILVARGTFLVSAIALPTPVSPLTEVPISTEEPSATEEPVMTGEPSMTEEPVMTGEPSTTEEPVVTEEPSATEESPMPLPDSVVTPEPPSHGR